MANNEDFIDQANRRFRAANDFLASWRAEARDDFAFVAGQQWTPEDEAILNEQRRPPITFNYSEKMIDAVIGAEVSNRQETSFLPRGIEDAGLADLWNAAAKYVREECNADDEESDAFRDALICGIGWTWTRLDYDRDLDGLVDISRIDPLEMSYDPAATKPGLTDRRWNDREWWVDDEEVRRRWPDAIPSQASDDPGRGVVRRGMRYADDDTSEFERHEGQSKIRLHEYWQMEDVYRVAVGGQLHEVDKKTLAQIKEQMPDVQSAKQKKRVYYRAWFMGETLLQGPERSPTQKGFTFNPITCKRDRNKGTWYGLTRVMKDPQRWANKWLSQILHIINTNAKGGILVELGAVVDPERFKEEWAQPDSVSLLNEGALSQKKVMPKPPAPYPTGLDKLMTFALDSLPMVTGINLEALGLANRDQAGVVESQRKQAAYGLLSPMFNALRNYRKTQGRVLLDFIQNYIADGRLIRIGGPESQQFLPLTKQDGAANYDVIVDQSPNAPDTKDKTWQALGDLIPAMLKAQVPVPPDVLDYAPIPTALAVKWKQFIGQQMQMQQEMQDQMQQLQQENDQLKADQQVKMQEMDLERQKMQQELQIEWQQTQAKMKMEADAHSQKMQLERAKAQSQFELESFKQDRQFELEGRRMQHENNMKQQQVDNDFKVKAFTAGVKADDAGKFQIDVNTGEIGDLVNQFAQASQQMAQQAQASQQATLQAIAQLTQALTKPRMLQYDQSGRPVGSTVQ